MKKVSFRLFVAMLFAVLFLASCGCEHEWQPADCRNPAICKKCGAAHGEPDAGKHEAVKDAAVAPTCTADGKAEGEHCSRCGKVLVPQEKIPAAGHEPVNFEAVQPTCAAEGRSAGSECAKCGAVLEGGETIAKLPHTEVVDPAVEESCETFGKTEGKHCSVCGEVIVRQENINPRHTYDNGACVRCGTISGDVPWTFKNYVDEFGNADGTYLAYEIFDGEYVGYLDDDGICAARIIVDKGRVSIAVYRKLFNEFEIVKGYSGQKYTVSVLDSNGKKHTFSGEVSRLLDRIEIVSNRNKFFSLLKSGKEITVCVYSEYGISYEQFLFTVKTYGFKPMYEKLK